MAWATRAARERPPELAALADPEGREPDADPVEVAKKIVLQQLSVSAKSRHQLAQVLTRRAVPSEAAEEALDRYTELGYIDGVIHPTETRARIAQALAMLANKRDTNPPKKHGNIPP